jgi:hypothetical protein
MFEMDRVAEVLGGAVELLHERGSRSYADRPS